MCPAFRHGAGAVRGPVIDNDRLPNRVGLVNHRVQGRLEGRFGVVRRDDDRNARGARGLGIRRGSDRREEDGVIHTGHSINPRWERLNALTPVLLAKHKAA